MAIYLPLYISLLFFSFAQIFLSKIRLGFVGNVVLLCMFLIAAMRYGTGTDFWTYQEIWNTAVPLGNGFSSHYSYLEPLFVFLNSALKLLYKGDFLFFSFYALLTLVLFRKGVSALNIHLLPALFFYFCLFYFSFLFNVMRQGVAMAIFFYSFHFLEKSKKKYFLLNLFGVGFHVTSLIYVFFGCISLIKFKRWFVLFTSAALPLASFLVHLSGLGYDFFVFVVELFGRTEAYLERWMEPTSFVQWVSRIVLYGFVLFLGFERYKIYLVRSALVFYILGFSLYILFSDVSLIGTRFNMVFRVVEIYIVGAYLANSSYNFNKAIVLTLFSIFYSLFFVVNIFNPDNIYTLRQSF